MSLSKNKIKYIQSLKDKKHRNLHGTFVAEGKKLVFDLLDVCKCEFIAVLPEAQHEIPPSFSSELIVSTAEELKKASFLKTPPQIIGVFCQPQYNLPEIKLKKSIHLVLDDIQDPGNLGTIVRLADWFGIEHVFCSKNTVDLYNPKTVQATMGAIARVKVHYVDLMYFLNEHHQIPVFGTFLEGENIYEAELPTNGFIVMGNEGKGISRELESLVTKKLFIPNFSSDRQTSESLNVAVATAIVCSEFKRRQ